MNAMLTMRSTSGVLTADEAPAITSGTTTSETSATRAWMRPSLWHAADMLQGIAVVFAVFYLLSVVGFTVALLFYTFNR
jgi:hypothetical protein